jgi:1-acyl-sn-glycerol-3-phosphate acyltransferase
MLFPEGRLTPDGEVQPFRRGLELILARDPVPVIPAGLSGLWGSWTSQSQGKALSKLPSRFRARVALTFGEPMGPHEVSRAGVEARVRALKAESDEWITTREQIGKARRH